MYPDSPELDPSYYDPEGDILSLEAILNSNPLPPLPNHDKSVPSFKDELKACEAKTIKYSIDEPPEVELKDLPPHLEYAFLEGDNKLPVIIAKALKDEEKSALIKVLKSTNEPSLGNYLTFRDLVSHKQSGNPTFSLHKEIASPEVIPEFYDSKGSNSLLEEFADELALISYPLDYDDNLACDIESDIKEIEFLLYQGEDSDFKDSIDQSVLTHRDDLFVDHTPEMFTEEQPPDYSFPPRFDVYPDDFLEIESDATFDDDSFDSEGEKIKEAELLIDPLDLPCDILSEFSYFQSQSDFHKPDEDFSCSKWKEYSFLGCYSVPFLSLLIRSSLPDLIPTQMTLELANRAICTPDEIARDVFIPVGKFTFPADFIVVNYESDPRVPLILGRPFLRTARALIDVHDCLKDLVSHKQSGNPTFSLHKEIASPEVILEFHDSKGCTFLSEELPDIDSFNDIHPYFDDDPLSDSTTYSANSFLEEFADELALISYPPGYEDNRVCDIESDIREIEFLLFQGKDSDFKDSIDQSVLTHCDDLFVDPTPEMFIDEQPPDYSFPPRFDVYPDDFLEIKSDATFDDDLFDSEGAKIKEAELLIDQLDLPCDILSEYDSFNSQDFSRDDVLFSPDNEDKVFNPGIISHEKTVKIITRFTQEKKLAVSNASWLSEDFDPSLYELLVFKEVPILMRLLSFSSENEEKVFKPGIYTFQKFHCCFLSELSHLGFPIFKVNMIFLSLMKIFHVQNGKNTPLLDVLLFYFYPP
uniref:Reverse transcriptase domain-containing protein n=2 Tax=Tanacetum cinerariifolium TaxID=118510 RepID=A0A699IMP3_TANCI|nr:reverse transcriptase domain-containing protein [Tanacetum cinerariifolium]